MAVNSFTDEKTHQVDDDPSWDFELKMCFLISPRGKVCGYLRERHSTISVRHGWSELMASFDEWTSFFDHSQPKGGSGVICLSVGC